MDFEQTFENTEELLREPLRVEIRCLVPPTTEQQMKISAFMRKKYDAD